MIKKISILIFLISIVGCSNGKKNDNKPLKSVDKLELSRYMGLWYEIGRYPNSFQKDNCDLATAEYLLMENGKVKVINSCWKDSFGGNRVEKVEGKAVLVKNEVSKLKVTFFWPFSGNYWIIELDEKEYSYAVVSEPKRKYLWILGRKPTMELEKIKEIEERLNKNGFNSNNIIWNRYMKNK